MLWKKVRNDGGSTVANILICKNCNGLGYRVKLFVVKRKCRRCMGKGRIKYKILGQKCLTIE